MGLHVAEIKFEERIPSFQEIAQHYKQLTGLDIQLVAAIHLATSEFGELLSASFPLLSILQADAMAVATIDAQYQAEIMPFLSTGHYEEAARLRDQKNQAKEHLNHIGSVEVIVAHGRFYPIEISVNGQIVTVNQYHNQYYAVVSLIRTLVELGGIYQWAGKKQLLPKNWQELKKWQEYKWYNRPKK